MAGQQEIDYVIIVFGTMGMLILALGLVAFVILYQKKRIRIEIQKVQRENEFQRDLLSATIDAREKEQERIAMELHDDIGSRLNTIKQRLFKPVLNDEDREELKEYLSDVISHIRIISNDLQPPVLYELGLHGAIKKLCRRINEDTDINVFCNIQDDEEKPEFLTQEKQLGIYRIIQEILNNIIKHANANNIEIVSEISDNRFELKITDNGSGFIPPDKLDFNSNSLGLKNITSRAQQINAHVIYTKQQSRGTRVHIILENK